MLLDKLQYETTEFRSALGRAMLKVLHEIGGRCEFVSTMEDRTLCLVWTGSLPCDPLTNVVVKHDVDITLMKMLPSETVVDAIASAIFDKFGHMNLVKSTLKSKEQDKQALNKEKYVAYVQAKKLLAGEYGMVSIDKSEYMALLDVERELRECENNRDRFMSALAKIFGHFEIDWSDGEPPVKELFDQIKVLEKLVAYKQSVIEDSVNVVVDMIKAHIVGDVTYTIDCDDKEVVIHWTWKTNIPGVSDKILSADRCVSWIDLEEYRKNGTLRKLATWFVEQIEKHVKMAVVLNSDLKIEFPDQSEEMKKYIEELENTILNQRRIIENLWKNVSKR